jgi:hypothetical protein
VATLDCETGETCAASLAALLGVSRADLEAARLRFDLDAFHRDNPHPQEDPDDTLVRSVTGRPPGTVVPDAVCWFHATRARHGADFSEGVRPLNEMLEALWAQMRVLADGWTTAEEWADFRANMTGDGAFQYHLKADDPMHWGPYAFLVREAIFCPSGLPNHDYLACPEIVEDICIVYGDRFGRDLRGAYRAATRPCIVKFISDVSRPDAVDAALRYLHALRWGHELRLSCNTCFDGQSKAVPARSILRVVSPEYAA